MLLLLPLVGKRLTRLELVNGLEDLLSLLLDGRDLRRLSNADFSLEGIFLSIKEAVSADAEAKLALVIVDVVLERIFRFVLLFSRFGWLLYYGCSFTFHKRGLH